MSDAAKFKDEDFLFAYVSEYIGGTLPGADQNRYQALLSHEAKQILVDKLNAQIGKFQLAVQGYYLSEDQRVRLHDIVEDAEVRRTREVNKIEEVGRFVQLSDMRRRVLLLIGVAALAAWVVWYFKPSKKADFDALEALSYEAMAMEEDPEGRLDLPSSDLKEIKSYVEAVKGADFTPRMLREIPAQYTPNGATIIDYDDAKIVAVQFTNASKKEKLFFFNFKGDLEKLPKSEPGNLQGFVYHTFASDVLNMIVWQQQDGVLGMLVGRQGALELAAIAKRGN